MRTGCDHNSTFWRAAIPFLPPIYYELHNTAFNLTHCLWTFAQLSASHYNDVPCFHMGLVNVHSCPQHCLRALSIDPDHARVYGSYPYHSASSVCLAAIHAGIITDEAGGGLFVERFYPETWNNDSSQTIFPHNSSASTLSNGVLTSPVSLIEDLPLPSPLTSHSWTVRTRGPRRPPTSDRPLPSTRWPLPLQHRHGAGSHLMAAPHRRGS